ncbi:hypothetical protein D3OALGB2SA_5125 [Olavius algarvensis associated proteobacterium Delta 3]|nr:hypothetical protein D3OALGB2SA_5125 [Olavius algarvensis associated proteobacterium Delta 3]
MVDESLGGRARIISKLGIRNPKSETKSQSQITKNPNSMGFRSW